MKPLLRIKDKLGSRHLVEQLRYLEPDDFDIEESIYAPDSCLAEQTEYHRRAKYVQHIHAVYVLKMKEEVLQHLIEVLGIKINEGRNGPIYSQREALGIFSAPWDVRACAIRAGYDVKVEYRGIAEANEKGRQKKYEQEREAMLNFWAVNKGILLETKLQELSNCLPKLYAETNRYFDEELIRIVGDLNIKEEWFDEHDSAASKQLRSEIKSLNEKIKELKEERKQKDEALVAVQREIVAHSLINSNFSDETKQRIQEIVGESPALPESRRRIFG